MNRKIIKFSLITGLIGGLLFCLFFFILYILYGNPFLSAKSNDFFIYLFTLFITFIIYRFRFNQGVLTFRQGFTIGLITSGLMLILSLVFIYSFLKLNPQVLEKQATYTLEQFEKNKEDYIEEWNNAGKDGSEIYRLTYENFQKRNWFNYLLREEVIQKFFTGLILTLILTILLRSRFLAT